MVTRVSFYLDVESREGLFGEHKSRRRTRSVARDVCTIEVTTVLFIMGRKQ